MTREDAKAMLARQHRERFGVDAPADALDAAVDHLIATGKVGEGDVRVQALGPHPDTGDLVDVTLDLAKCLQVAHTMRALVHSDRKMPDDTKALLFEVGSQMLSAANAKMRQRIAIARESAAKARAK